MDIFLILNLSCKIEATVSFNIPVASTIMCNFILRSLNTMLRILLIISGVLTSTGCPQ